MTEKDDPERGTDESTDSEGLALDRRTALKGGAAGLAALGIGAFGTTSAVADHDPANKVAAAGSNVQIAEVTKQNSTNISSIHSLLGPVDMKTSGDEKQGLVFQPTIESSLFTDVKVKGNDTESTAKAGVLGWVEITGDATGGATRMVTADGGYVDPPSSADELASAMDSFGTSDWPLTGVVAFNTRDLKLEWDIADLEDDDMLALYLRTRSANAFNWIAPEVTGQNTVELKGALYVYVDDDKAEAQAMVGNRTMYVEPVKLHHDVQ